MSIIFHGLYVLIMYIVVLCIGIMPGGSVTRRLLHKRTYSNQPNNVATSNSQHSSGPSNEEELERTNNVDEGDEQVEEEEESETIPTQGYNPAIDPVTKKPPLEWKGN